MSTTERNADTRQLEALRDAAVRRFTSFPGSVLPGAAEAVAAVCNDAIATLKAEQPQAEAQPARCEGFEHQPYSMCLGGQWCKEPPMCHCRNCGQPYSACMASREPKDLAVAETLPAAASETENLPTATVNPQPAAAPQPVAVPDVPTQGDLLRETDAPSLRSMGLALRAKLVEALGEVERTALREADATRLWREQRARADALEQDCRRYEWAAASAKAVLMDCEAKNDKLRAELAALKGQEAVVRIAREPNGGMSLDWLGEKPFMSCDLLGGPLSHAMGRILGKDRERLLYAAPVAAKEPSKEETK